MEDFSMIVECILVFLVGVFLLIKPEIVWEITRKWNKTKGRPSALYYKCAKALGIACTVVGLLGTVLFLVI